MVHTPFRKIDPISVGAFELLRPEDGDWELHSDDFDVLYTTFPGGLSEDDAKRCAKAFSDGYDQGKRKGEITGRIKLQSELRCLLDAAGRYDTNELSQRIDRVEGK